MRISLRTLGCLAWAGAALSISPSAQTFSQGYSGSPSAPIGTSVAIDQQDWSGGKTIHAAGIPIRGWVRVWEDGVGRLLLPSTGAGTAGERFGAAVDILTVPAIQLTFVAVGAPLNHATVSGGGRVVVYELSSGQSWSLPAPRPVVSGFFGESLALGLRSGVPILVVGQPGASGNRDAGSAQVYAYDPTYGWIPEATLESFGGGHAVGDRFGAAVAVDGGNIVIGAPSHSSLARGAGAGFFFHHVGGVWQPGHREVSFWTGIQLGASVDVCDDHAVLGAPHWAGITPREGMVMLFERVGGTFAYMADHINTESDSMFGSAVALSGGTRPFLVIGKHGAFGVGECSLLQLRGQLGWQHLSNWRATALQAQGRHGEAVDIVRYARRLQSGQPVIAVGAPGSGVGGHVELHALPSLFTSDRFGGRGTVGYGGVEPGLEFAGEWSRGHRVSITSRGRPDAPMALFIGATPLSFSILGGTLYVTPDIVVSGRYDSFGNWQLPLQLPRVFPLDMHFQAVVFDPAAASGIAFSSGLTVFGPR